MKRLIVSLITLGLAAASASAQVNIVKAQTDTVVAGTDTTLVVNGLAKIKDDKIIVSGNGVVVYNDGTIKSEDGTKFYNDNNNISMEIAGFRIKLGSRKSTKTIPSISLKMNRTKNKLNFDLIGPFSFGWSTLTNNNYYGDWAGQGNFLLQSNCFTFGMSFARIELALSKHLEFDAGFRWSCTNYNFGTPVILVDDLRGKTMPLFPTPEKMGYTGKMYLSYMGIPVGLSFKANNLTIGFNVSAEILLQGCSKWKEEKTEYNFSALNTFKSRAEFILGYHKVGGFISYDITPVFVPGSGNDCHLLTLGFMVAI